MKRYDELSRDEKLDLFAAYLDGKPIEYNSAHTVGWQVSPHPTWAPNNYYRVKKVPLKINWKHVSPKFVAMAKDRNGSVFLYSTIPSKTRDQWSLTSSTRGESAIPATPFASFEDSDIDWTDSLVTRP